MAGVAADNMSGCFLPILRLALLLLVHINVLATANADRESESGKPIVFSAFNAGSITGLDFLGSAAVKTTMRFKFTNPHNDGLPIYGAGGRGVTYIWRAYPRQQDSYYTAFFWGNDDGQNNLNTFYGRG
jgi:hypothetical protein